MTTRFYLRSSASTTPISPAVDSGWGVSSGLQRATMSPVAQNTDMATSSWDDSDNTDNDVVLWQYIYSLPEGFTITGSQAIKFQARWKERVAACNLSTTLTLRVIASNGTTVRKTMIPITSSGTEFSSSTLTNRSFYVVSEAGDYTTVAGDCLVLEIGASGDPGGSADHDFDISLGDKILDTDLPEDDSTTGEYRPWLEVTDTISVTGILPNLLTIEIDPVDPVIAAGTSVTLPSASIAVSLAIPIVTTDIAAFIQPVEISATTSNPSVVVGTELSLSPISITIDDVLPNIVGELEADPESIEVSIAQPTVSVGTSITINSSDIEIELISPRVWPEVGVQTLSDIEVAIVAPTIVNGVECYLQTTGIEILAVGTVYDTEITLDAMSIEIDLQTPGEPVVTVGTHLFLERTEIHIDFEIPIVIFPVVGPVIDVDITIMSPTVVNGEELAAPTPSISISDIPPVVVNGTELTQSSTTIQITTSAPTISVHTEITAENENISVAIVPPSASVGTTLVMSPISIPVTFDAIYAEASPVTPPLTIEVDVVSPGVENDSNVIPVKPEITITMVDVSVDSGGDVTAQIDIAVDLGSVTLDVGTNVPTQTSEIQISIVSPNAETGTELNAGPEPAIEVDPIEPSIENGVEVTIGPVDIAIDQIEPVLGFGVLQEAIDITISPVPPLVSVGTDVTPDITEIHVESINVHLSGVRKVHVIAMDEYSPGAAASSVF